MKLLTASALKHPKAWFTISTLVSLFLVSLVALPTLWPKPVSFLNPLHVDTDPENMLSPSEPVRMFHNEMKKKFGLYDIIVVGIVNHTHPQGVFNKDSLLHIYDLTQKALSLQWQTGGEQKGVIAADVIAPSTVDNIEQGGLGSVRFDWLMPAPPQTEEAALEIAQRAARIPFLNGTLVSEDQKALALYIPITSKGDSYEVAEKLREKISEFNTDDDYYITGLPVAQDQFGVEMFKQMAVSAPLAMLLIFALMWYFFRHVKLIVAPMIVAIFSVIMTMTLLISTGHTLHIMSSMIPIFIMPIAVLDAVHILSDFFDRYPIYKDRKKTIEHVMADLKMPLLYTSLTTCAGFGSLIFTPIPPVQVFGIFISIGVFLAWLLTVTLVPAYVMLLPESSLDGFGLKTNHKESKRSFLSTLLLNCGYFSTRRARWILLSVPLIVILAIYGINKIVINDNPVRWFEFQHPIRVADRALNEKFGGTYMAYLSLDAGKAKDAQLTKKDLSILSSTVRQALGKKLNTGESLEGLYNYALEQSDLAVSDADWEKWDQAVLLLDKKNQEKEVFKRPDVLRYVENLQQHLLNTGIVGKSNGLPDIIKTVHRDLFLGEEKAFRIPATIPAVAQTLITYESSHRPQDLWHFVLPDYRTTNLWIQLKSGDNEDMRKVVDLVNQYMNNFPPPIDLDHKWFGLTYINVIWQQKMVTGMRSAFMGSFVIVLIMMILLFRSFLWGLLSMIPLASSIAVIYGVIGFIGKDFDMPVAVLSSLSLGLAVDYAIHFLARSRAIRKKHGDWKSAVEDVFSEPARAIARNVVVIGVGFLPLLAAPLVPYKTVGFFISAILVLAGATSLFILPALITRLEPFLFSKKKGE